MFLSIDSHACRKIERLNINRRIDYFIVLFFSLACLSYYLLSIFIFNFNAVTIVQKNHIASIRNRIFSQDILINWNQLFLVPHAKNNNYIQSDVYERHS